MAIKVLVTPQDPLQTKSKSSKVKKLNHLDLSPKGKKSKTQQASLSPFAQILFQAQQHNQNRQTASPPSPKEPPLSPIDPAISQRKMQMIANQKALQHPVKSKNLAPSHEKQHQLREALMIKSDRKTTRDIQKIAKEQNLNLTKLEITSSKKSKAPKQNLPQTKPSSLPNVTTTQAKNQTPLAKEVAPLELPQNTLEPSQTPMQTSTPPNTIAKDASLASLLSLKEKEEKLSTQDSLEEKKIEKNQDLTLSESKKETQFKIAQSKETFNHFSQRLKEEIANYKPPFTRLLMELNPQELGKLEITITKKGKELQVSVNANNPNALQTFIQHQNEFKATLSEIGFSNVELNFSQSDQQKKNQQQDEEKQKGNKNSFEELKETPLATSMEIKMVQYA